MSSLTLAFISSVPVVFPSLTSSSVSSTFRRRKAKQRTTNSAIISALKHSNFPIAFQFRTFLRPQKRTRKAAPPLPPPPPPPALRALVTQFVLHESSIRQSARKSKSTPKVSAALPPWFSKIFVFMTTVIATAIGAPTPPKA